MKKIFIITAIIVLTSCVKDMKRDPDPVDPVVTERLTTVEKIDVPVKSGMTTIVTLGSDTLCVTTEATSIWAPKIQPVTKAAEDIVISYHEGTDPAAGSSQLWQTIAFEDSEAADYDYNDIVIHCKYEFTRGRFGIGVHPIALGSTKTIALGCKVYVHGVLFQDKLLCTNCREELFIQDGSVMEGFVNTGSTANFHTNNFQAQLILETGASNMTDISVVWYIKVGGSIFYSVNDHYGYLDANHRPYGIIFTNTGNTFYQDERNPAVGSNWFAYPFELININQAYPQFDEWISGTRESCDFSSPVAGKTIDLDTYSYNRPDFGPTRVYYCPTNKKVI